MSEEMPLVKQAREFATTMFLNQYAQNGKFKMNAQTYRADIELTHILGELSGAERILKLLDSGSVDSLDVARGDIHIFLKDVHNLLCDKYKLDRKKVGVEDFINGRFGPDRYSAPTL